MPPYPPEYYIDLRDQYKPKKTGLVFLAESPPENGGYFYDTRDLDHQLLFRAMMKLIGYRFEKLDRKTKEGGLREFQMYGCILVDAIYYPVNRLPDKQADILIAANYRNLISDLNSLVNNKAKIIIVKTSLYNMLY